MAEITMKQHNRIMSGSMIRGLIAVIAAGAVLAVAAVAFIWFSGGNGQASAPIVASHLTREPGDTRSHFHILTEQSEVLFRIDELLFGESKTVIGSTNQVAGEMLIDFDHPADSQLGLIRINVRTLTTDNEFRNRALRGQILEADEDEYEFAEFAPTDLLQLPTDIAVGDTVDFQILGILSVHGVSRKVSFEASVTIVSEEHIEGHANTIVRYQDFDMTVPDAPGVANVSDEVELEIQFVAQIITE